MAEVWYWIGVVVPWVILVVCSLVGLVGTLLPAVPGGALILLGTWIFAFWTGFQRMAMEPPQPWLIGWPTLTLVTLLAIVGGVGQYFVSGLGARKFGASNWGVAGALAGFVIGLTFTPIGALIGAFVGAAAVEYLVALHRRTRVPAPGEEVPKDDEVEVLDAPVEETGEAGLPAPVDGDAVSSRWHRVGGALKREGKDAGKASLAGFGAVLGAVASFIFEFVFGLMMILVIIVGLIL